MVTAIRTFVERIESSRNRYIKKVLRVKNGFTKFRYIHDTSSINLSDCEYNDIKINVLISNEDGSIQIIGETQWLLNIMKIVKEKGHSLYSLVRSKEFVDNVSSISNDISLSNIERDIHKRDIHQLENYLLSGNYDIVNEYNSIMNNTDIESNDKIKYFLLSQLFQLGWFKGGKLLLSHIYYLLKMSKNSGDTVTVNVIKKYLNCDKVIEINITTESFFGIELDLLEKGSSDDVKMISKIIVNYFLYSQYFNTIEDETLIYSCVEKNLFQFLSLLIEYRSNDSGIENGINYINEQSDSQKLTPLGLLLISEHCNNDWINLLLSLKNIDINIECVYNDKKCNVKQLTQNKKWINIIETFEMKQQTIKTNK